MNNPHNVSIVEHICPNCKTDKLYTLALVKLASILSKTISTPIFPFMWNWDLIRLCKEQRLALIQFDDQINSFTNLNPAESQLLRFYIKYNIQILERAIAFNDGQSYNFRL
jgi:hypothetical protein